MKKTHPKLILASIIAAGALLFNGCETTNSSENTARLATLKTFHMEAVNGGLHNFVSRDPQDVTVLTQEEVARQFELKGYVEVPLSEPADFSVSPGWVFFEARDRNNKFNEPNVFGTGMQTNAATRMARLFVNVKANDGTQLWEGSASWGIQTNVNTASDFTQAATLATSTLPDSTSVSTSTPTGNVPAMPPIPQ